MKELEFIRPAPGAFQGLELDYAELERRAFEELRLSFFRLKYWCWFKGLQVQPFIHDQYLIEGREHGT